MLIPCRALLIPNDGAAPLIRAAHDDRLGRRFFHFHVVDPTASRLARPLGERLALPRTSQQLELAVFIDGLGAGSRPGALAIAQTSILHLESFLMVLLRSDHHSDGWPPALL